MQSATCHDSSRSLYGVDGEWDKRKKTWVWVFAYTFFSSAHILYSDMAKK